MIIAKFMYMGYHIPLSFAVTLKSKKLKSFLKKKKVLIQETKWESTWPSSSLQHSDRSLTIFGDKKKYCDILRSLTVHETEWKSAEVPKNFKIHELLSKFGQICNCRFQGLILCEL